MSQLTDSSTREEVIQAIESGDIHCYLEIPAHHQTESMAFTWLQKTRLTSIWLQKSFEAVPSKFRTTQFMLLAIELGCWVLKVATPEQYANYREIAFASIKEDGAELEDLDPRFRDEQMIAYAQKCWPTLMYIYAKRCGWLMDTMSDELLEKTARHDTLFALMAPPLRLREPLHRYITLRTLSKRMWDHCINPENGHLSMLADKVRNGEWFDGGYMKLDKPDSLTEAICGLANVRPDAEVHSIVLMVYIMSYPIDEVVPAMQENRLKKRLLEMYPLEALQPFMKTDAGLRGAMLERALGL
jgi:hypothetical protein